MLGQTNIENVSRINYGQYKWTRFTISSGTNSQSITLTTAGRPVYLCINGDNNPTSSSAWIRLYIKRDTTILCTQIDLATAASGNNPFSLSYLDIVPAGTYVYTADIQLGSGSTTLGEDGDHQAPQFLAFEI